MSSDAVAWKTEKASSIVHFFVLVVNCCGMKDWKSVEYCTFFCFRSQLWIFIFILRHPFPINSLESNVKCKVNDIYMDILELSYILPAWPTRSSTGPTLLPSPSINTSTNTARLRVQHQSNPSFLVPSFVISNAVNLLHPNVSEFGDGKHFLNFCLLLVYNETCGFLKSRLYSFTWWCFSEMNKRK